MYLSSPSKNSKYMEIPDDGVLSTLNACAYNNETTFKILNNWRFKWNFILDEFLCTKRSVYFLLQGKEICAPGTSLKKKYNFFNMHFSNIQSNGCSIYFIISSWDILSKFQLTWGERASYSLRVCRVKSNLSTIIHWKPSSMADSYMNTEDLVYWKFGSEWQETL